MLTCQRKRTLNKKKDAHLNHCKHTPTAGALEVQVVGPVEEVDEDEGEGEGQP